jgi:hypothetical protein
MNKSRSAYLKVFPLVFLLALVITAMQLYREYHQPEFKGDNTLLEWSVVILQIGGIWVAVGLAFKQWKAALFALGTALAILALEYFIYKSGIMKDVPIAVRYVYEFLISFYFTPMLVFALLCFRKQGILYFLPFILFGTALLIVQVGFNYLETSPYNRWYFLFRIDRLLEVPVGERSFRALNLFKFTANMAFITCMYTLIGEAYTAAMNPQKWKQLLRIDLSTNYSRAGAITLFFSLRLLISILVVGMLTFPMAASGSGGRFYFGHIALHTLILAIVAGIALLVFVILYYRKFLVEYFIANGHKTQWLFWIVNMPIIGMLIFPIAALDMNRKTTEEERTQFFYNKAIYAPRAWGIIGVMALTGFFILGFSPKYQVGEIQWGLWGFEVCLLIWLAADISGYYAMLALAFISFIVFFSQQIRSDESIITWYTVMFNIVNLIILLPVFHLYKMKTIQEPPTYVEESQEVSIPIGQA